MFNSFPFPKFKNRLEKMNSPVRLKYCEFLNRNPSDVLYFLCLRKIQTTPKKCKNLWNLYICSKASQRRKEGNNCVKAFKCSVHAKFYLNCHFVKSTHGIFQYKTSTRTLYWIYSSAVAKKEGGRLKINLLAVKW